MAAKGGEKEGGGEEEEEEEEAAVNETQDHHHAAMPMPLCLIGEGLRSIPLLNSAALTCLSLHGNKISSFVGLEAATGLRELNLSSNELTASSLSSSGACLSPLVNLEELNLSANRLESVAELPLLPSLKHLRLAHNRLKSLTGISAAAGTTLISLDVRDNDIMHPLSRHVLDMKGLERLEVLQLSPNPLFDGIVGSSASVGFLLRREVLPKLRIIDDDHSLDGAQALRGDLETGCMARTPIFDKVVERFVRGETSILEIEESDDEEEDGLLRGLDTLAAAAISQRGAGAPDAGGQRPPSAVPMTRVKRPSSSNPWSTGKAPVTRVPSKLSRMAANVAVKCRTKVTGRADVTTQVSATATSMTAASQTECAAHASASTQTQAIGPSIDAGIQVLALPQGTDEATQTLAQSAPPRALVLANIAMRWRRLQIGRSFDRWLCAAALSAALSRQVARVMGAIEAAGNDRAFVSGAEFPDSAYAAVRRIVNNYKRDVAELRDQLEVNNAKLSSSDLDMAALKEELRKHLLVGGEAEALRRGAEAEAKSLREELQRVHDSHARLDEQGARSAKLMEDHNRELEEALKVEVHSRRSLEERVRDLADEQAASRRALADMEADHKRTLRESVSIAEEEVRKANAVANAKVRTVSTAFEQLAEAARGLQKAEAQQRREAQTASAAAAKTRAELEGLKTELISLRDTQTQAEDCKRNLVSREEEIGCLHRELEELHTKAREAQRIGGELAVKEQVLNDLQERLRAALEGQREAASESQRMKARLQVLEGVEERLSDVLKDLRRAERKRAEAEQNLQTRDDALRYIESEMENVRKARAEEITSLKAEVARATEEATSLREQAAASLESSRLLKKEAEARGKEATTLSLETAGLRAVEEALSRELSEARAEVARERQQAEDACNENAILRKEMTELIKSVDTERAAARLKAQTAASITKKLADAAADAAKGLVA